MKKKLLVILLFHLCGIAFAQTSITGRVTSAGGGEPLPGVSVVVKGTTVGSSTDTDGRFQIQAPATGTTLVFSYIGFTSKEEPINGRTTVNVTLQEDLRALEEVVVVGYGTQLRREVTTAISSVSSEEITQTPVTRIEQALQGRVAGVQVTNISGQPGDAPTVRIRGIGSTGNASPIYIVDGFPVGGIDYLNPGDIASIDVLKDAASAAIYGARGGNGVVIITTKQGKRDGTMNVSYDGYMGIQNPWRKLELLNAREYATLMNEGAANANMAPPYADPSQFSEGTNWQDAIFEKNAPIQNHQVSINGGNEKSGYSAALSYFDQDGIVGGDKSNFQRYTARVNADNQVKSFLKFGTNLAYTHLKRRSFDPNQEFGGILSNALNMDPLTPVYETDPAKLAQSTYTQNPVVRGADGRIFAISPYVSQEVVNPLARLQVMNGLTNVDKFVGNIYGEVKLLEGLTFRSTLGIDLAYVVSTNYNPVFYLNAAQQNATALVSRGTDRYYTWQTENYFNYNKSLGEHSLGLTAGTSALKTRNEGLFGSNTGLVTADPNMAYLNNAVGAGTARATGGIGERSILSFFGRANYGYKGKYLLSATLRRDGSSRFGRNNQFATFPSFSAGWVLSDEGFFPQGNLISLAKIRASWGQNGNEEIGGNFYPWAAQIGVGRGYTFFRADGSKGYTSGAAPVDAPNPELQWETSEQTNVGLDLSFFNNALSLTADYYIKTTKGLLVRPPILASTGYNSPFVNGGSVRNTGVELALSYQGDISNLGYNVSLNSSFNKNEVTSIENKEGILTGASFTTYGLASQSKVGFPIGYFYGYKTAGIFQNQREVEAQKLQMNAVPGDVRFVDINNDGKLDGADRTMIGNPTPKVVLGLNLGVDFKGFDLSAFFNSAFGHHIFNGIRRYDIVRANQQSKFLNRWTGEGSTNEYPRFTWNDTNGNYTRLSDLYVEDGDYVRLKTLQLGYNLPAGLLSRIHLQKLRIYVSADNLITLTDYSGFDPEIGARGSLDIGFDRGVYPQSRTFRLGFNATF
ncbi:SusC/RagA family TonB-linked outer membrane protein [Rufibacter glacialis]|uniref:SusC/RagA family TonB-linked outer membrane protein n=1 Tax=Rufibacter glacialis TaxID=1259555 RepID=A0A5M8QL85_9BACT|nr:TonB-dependent receptor [Rufibacter glacialis]KAA6435526.1 TonB-dependent receptor [Rufibacter glacialis]GGK64265.1 SusC/RagA family TonB-linked outer membrane protein [Rufibacter glacialis]